MTLSVLARSRDPLEKLTVAQQANHRDQVRIMQNK